jgi:hypothetical protein
MKHLNKTSAIVISIFLMISMGASMLLIPSANAHTPAWSIPTYAFINAAPNPVGVGQKINVIMWLDKIMDGAADGNDIRWHNYKLTITKPDLTTETTTFPVCQDPTSAQFYSYTPDQLGTYTFTFNFPGQQYTYTGLIFGFFGPPAPSAYVNDTYLPSSSTTTVTVQQEQIATITSYPLPSNYWTRPIYGENTDWWSISSNWLGTGSPQFTTENSFTNKYIPDAIGPQTAHIMWTKPLQSGGVVGGNNFLVKGVNYFEGSAYINRYTNPIIIDGMLFYNPPLSFATGSTVPTNCVDLQTGQLIWSRSDVPAPSFGLVFDLPPGNPNQHGVFPPLLISTSGTTWMAYDADTGNWLFNATNVPPSASSFFSVSANAAAMGPQGEFITYVLNNNGNSTKPNWYIGEWNSTDIIYSSAGGFGLSPVNSGIIDASGKNMYDWNVSASGLNAITSSPTTLVAYYGDVMLGYSGTIASGGSPAAFGRYSEVPYTYYAINLNASRGALGSILWTNTVQPPAGNVTVFSAGSDPISRIFVESYKETRQWVAYSLDTGQKLWGPVGNETNLDYYGNDFGGVPDAQLAYGNVYYSGFGGVIFCYDAKTGDLKWTYGNGGAGNSTSSGPYTGYGVYPTYITAIGNGIIYTETSEHTILNPIYKGALTRAINATDGTEIWTLSAYTGGGGSSTSYAIADGFATFFNGYDNQIYVVGRGPSAITVEAPLAAITKGSSLIIQGSVTDTSAGTKQNQQAADFPNGVPVASDASMKDWMGYVYQQKPLPNNFKGVDATIDVLDSNGNYRNIGTTTTDATGRYSLQWTPDIPGKYTVIATFHGTNGYWGSYSETSFAVDLAAPTTVPTNAPQTNLATTTDLMTYILVSAIAIIIAIAIATVLMLRKRP